MTRWDHEPDLQNTFRKQMDKFKRCNETLFHNVRPPSRKACINPLAPTLIPSTLLRCP